MKLCVADNIVGIKDSYILRGNSKNYYICVKKGTRIQDFSFENEFYINNYDIAFELISNKNEIYESLCGEFAWIKERHVRRVKRPRCWASGPGNHPGG